MRELRRRVTVQVMAMDIDAEAPPLLLVADELARDRALARSRRRRGACGAEAVPMRGSVQPEVVQVNIMWAVPFVVRLVKRLRDAA